MDLQVCGEPVRFTLVTTCYNESDSVITWRRDLESQTRQPDEIVIVDGGSTDGTAKELFHWARQESRLKVHVERCNVARGRNLAIAMATSEHIVSTDMGVRLSPKWFEEIIHPFEEDPAIDVVAGNTQIDRQTVKTAVARAEYYIENGGELILGPGFVPGNRSVAYRIRVWRELGGLPEDLTLAADDSVFGRQILQSGYRVAYAPKAMTYWGRPGRLRDFCKEKYNYGRGDGEAAIKTPFAFKLYRKGRIPKAFVPLLTGLRGLQKHLKLASVLRVMRAGDFPALAMMPVLVFCRDYSFGKGYLVGDAHGQDHCQGCRKRLHREAQTMQSRASRGIAS